ncbi:MAG: histidine phosphatase family protein [Hominenteromicrobium sp.]|jgi:phosphoglycerate mutase family protein|uniref:histidine phosphatase family protein n=1 Tax=Hominenteromicrobium sp. TaxID=3073581 RepID=UPI003A3F0FBF
MKNIKRGLMMGLNSTTILYFIRHAEPDFSEPDNYKRKLTVSGEIQAQRLSEIFNDINVDGVYSSPYLRAIKTVEPIAKSKSLNVQLLDQFRERKSSDYRVSKEKFLGYGKHQWDDFDFKLCGGESLNDVKNRYNTGVRIIINQHAQSQNCIFAVGCHIAGLCAYISQFNLISNYEEYKKYASKMPLIVKCFYKNLKFVSGEICNFK